MPAARPAGFRYAVFQAADSGEFIHLYTDEGGAPGALQQLSAFQAFVAGALFPLELGVLDDVVSHEATIPSAQPETRCVKKTSQSASQTHPPSKSFATPS